MSLFSKQIDKRIAAYQRELIETHYQEVDNMYRKMRGWRHDYRNHIQAMKVMAANGNMDGIKAYLDELDTDLNTVDTVVKTGNAMADAILNSKISLAQSKSIAVHCDAHIPVKLQMSELDLCCILGNLFDNAIEASLSPAGGRAANPGVHGHEGNPALHFLHQFHIRQETEQGWKSVSDLQGRGSRLRPGAD